VLTEDVEKPERGDDGEQRHERAACATGTAGRAAG
jgi:hypothetical protein